MTVVPHLRVRTPQWVHRINLRCHEMIDKLAKTIKKTFFFLRKILFIFEDIQLCFLLLKYCIALPLKASKKYSNQTI